jgi:hypothetical protein
MSNAGYQPRERASGFTRTTTVADVDSDTDPDLDGNSNDTDSYSVSLDSPYRGLVGVTQACKGRIARLAILETAVSRSPNDLRSQSRLMRAMNGLCKAYNDTPHANGLSLVMCELPKQGTRIDGVGGMARLCAVRYMSHTLTLLTRRDATTDPRLLVCGARCMVIISKYKNIYSRMAPVPTLSSPCWQLEDQTLDLLYTQWTHGKSLPALDRMTEGRSEGGRVWYTSSNAKEGVAAWMYGMHLALGQYREATVIVDSMGDGLKNMSSDLRDLVHSLGERHAVLEVLVSTDMAARLCHTRKFESALAHAEEALGNLDQLMELDDGRTKKQAPGVYAGPSQSVAESVREATHGQIEARHKSLLDIRKKCKSALELLKGANTLGNSDSVSSEGCLVDVPTAIGLSSEDQERWTISFVQPIVTSKPFKFSVHIDLR